MNKSLNLQALADALPRAGLSPARLAARLGVSREAVSKWLHGESVPQPDKLLRLGTLLGLTYEELVRMPRPAVGKGPIVRYRDASRKASRKKTTPRVAEAVAAYGGPGGEILLYRAPDGSINLDVRLERETIWLTQAQMAELFATERSVVTKHVGNIFGSGELEMKSNVQKMHIPGSDRPVSFFSLDVAISVGYRVNSMRGTQFRIWATRTLRDHVLKGYTVNTRRLKELNQAVRLIADVAERRALSGDEATALLRVVADYSRALDLLDAYDHQRLGLAGTTVREVVPLTYEEAIRTVGELRRTFGGSTLFGREKDASLRGALAAVVQTFGGRDLYPSLEEKAAHLLYFLVKNHPFVDGNKRIAAALFLWFMEKNGTLYAADGRKRIADNALVAMTLLIAESRPAEKDILTRVVVNLIDKQNG
jgi:prophage maintenance system killer protein/transcriptional regulator with XRE-family HTH domain